MEIERCSPKSESNAMMETEGMETAVPLSARISDPQ